MPFDFSKVIEFWDRFKERPKWFRILFFVVACVVVLALVAWSVVKYVSSKKTVATPSSATQVEVEEYFEEEMEETKAKSEELDEVIKAEDEKQETMDEKQEEVHNDFERQRDEIRDADSISSITNSLRNGRG